MSVALDAISVEAAFPSSRGALFTRTRSCILQWSNAKTLGEVAKIPHHELIRFPNVGKKVVETINLVLAEHGTVDDFEEIRKSTILRRLRKAAWAIGGARAVVEDVDRLDAIVAQLEELIA
jgi:hypothetical protein